MSRTAAEREELILSLKDHVETLARWRCRSLFSARYDEILSAAWVGAINAVDHFDPSHGASLKTYASARIRGEIADYLRSVDPISRDHRRLINNGGCEAPRRVELEAAAGSVGKYDQQYEAIDARMTVQRLVDIAKVQPRHMTVLVRHARGEKLKQIGASLGVNESRASQMRASALAQLRAAA